MASSKVAIVIPAYNEEGSIKSVINELNKVLIDIYIDIDIDIVVVNDCSSDTTVNKVKEANAHVVDLKVNHGYSKAIEQGLIFSCEKLKVDYLVTMDADGQHDPASVKEIINLILSDNFDMVVGERGKCARFSEKLYALYYKLKFGISDPLCGLKAYKTPFFVKYGKFETFDSIGTELLTWALLNKSKITESKVNIRPRNDEPRFGSSFSANKRIFKSLIQSIAYIKRYPKT